MAVVEERMKNDGFLDFYGNDGSDDSAHNDSFRKGIFKKSSQGNKSDIRIPYRQVHL